MGKLVIAMYRLRPIQKVCLLYTCNIPRVLYISSEKAKQWLSQLAEPESSPVAVVMPTALSASYPTCGHLARQPRDHVSRRFVHADRSTDLPFLYVPGHTAPRGRVLNYAPISRGHLGRLILICGRVDGQRPCRPTASVIKRNKASHL